MEKIWDSIVWFFTKAVPTFVMDNLVAVIVVAALVLISIILMVALAKKGKKCRFFKGDAIIARKSEAETKDSLIRKSKELDEAHTLYRQLDAKYTDVCEKEAQAKEDYESLKEQYEKMDKGYNSCKELLAAAEIENAARSAECSEKDTLIANMTLEADAYRKTFEGQKEEILSLTMANTKLQAENKGLSLIKDSNSDTLAELRNRAASLMSDNSLLNKELSEKRTALMTAEKDIINYKNEIERLKNFEFENKILVGMLRNGSADIEKAQEFVKSEKEVILEDVLEEFNDDIVKAEDVDAEIEESIVEADMTVVDELDTLKRRELFKMARELGLKDYALWTNDKLKEEIRSLKK